MSGEASQKGKAAAKRHERVERGIYKRMTRDGVRYEFNFTGSDGKTHWLTASRLQDARNGRAAKMAAVARGEQVAPSKQTVAQLAEEWFEQKQRKLRKKTEKSYRRALDVVIIPRFGRWKVQQIDADAIVRLIRDLESEGLHAIDPSIKARPLGASSIDNYLKPLHGLLALAVRRGKIGQSPFTVMTDDDRPTKPEKQKAYEWTDDELDALITASTILASRPESRYDYTPLLVVMAALGLRIGEALGLQWQDFDKNDAILRVQRQWLQSREYGPTKTRAGDRKIPLSVELREFLIALRLRSRFSGDADPIFASLNGTPLSYRNVLRRGWDPARDAAGLPGWLTPHQLRHASVSRLLFGNLDPVTVAEMHGHSDVNVTLGTYAHPFNRDDANKRVRAAIRVPVVRESGR